MSNFLNGSEHCPNENSQHTSETGSGQVQDEQKQTIRECVAASLTDYFEKVDHENISELYELVLSEVEAPLLETVMRHTRSNQSKASVMLGLNRGTLRKKLKKYDMLT